MPACRLMEKVERILVSLGQERGFKVERMVKCLRIRSRKGRFSDTDRKLIESIVDNYGAHMWYTGTLYVSKSRRCSGWEI